MLLKENIFIKTAFDLSSFIGVIIIIGLLLGFLRTASMNNYQKRFGEKAVFVTGIVGVPVHELSHYILAKLFGHKVTEVKLFQMKDGDGTLGYVNHAYNPMNLYQQIGNFFIGVAPILCGSLVIILLLKFFVPDSLNLMNGAMSLKGSMGFLKSIFTLDNFKRPEFYLFLYLVFSICSHISLSKADIKGAFIGVIFMFIILLVFNYLNLNILSRININKYNFLVMNVLIISVIFSVINFIISYLLKMIRI